MKKTLATLILVLTFMFVGLAQNNSLDFDGTDDYVDLGDINALDGLSALTIEVWLKLHTHRAFDRIIVKEIDGDATNGWGMALSSTSGELSLYTRNGSNSNSQTTGNVIPLNTWTHIAYVFDGSGSGNTDRLKCYVNGSPVTLSYNGTVPSSLNSNSSSVTFSRTSNAASEWIDAQMDDIRIWTVARTQTEIQNNKDTELVGTESGLFAYFKMDEVNSSCDVEDCNSNENHGTRNGSGGGNNLPQYSSDVPSLTDVACGATTSCTILPVELVEFKGQVNRNQIRLSWETASELNNSGFEIQKSRDGRDWKIIDFVAGQGTTSESHKYWHQDLIPFSGINYYRLKQIDFDGGFEYSKVIAVEYSNSERKTKVFPNPSNGLVNLQINNPSNQRMEIKVLDNLGRTIMEREVVEDESNWQGEMEIKGSGIYIITVQIGDEIFYERMVIDN